MSHSGLFLAPNIQPVAYTLMQLFISKTNVSNLPVNYFNKCNKLSKLNLPGNKFRSIPNITQLSYILQILDISDNIVSDISMLYQTPYPQLDILYLQNNHIAHFPYPIWGWPRLVSVYIYGNRIHSLTHELFSKAARLLWFYANDNPWNCSHDLCWLAHCVLNTADEHFKYYQCGRTRWELSKTGLVCSSPPGWKGREIALTGNIGIYLQ